MKVMKAQHLCPVHHRKAQVAIEYIAILFVVMVMLLPIWAYTGSVKDQTISQLSLSYAQNAVDKIASSASVVNSQGPPARLKMQIYMPHGINTSNVTGNTVMLSMLTESGRNDVISISSATLNGTIPNSEGLYWITIEAGLGFVNITY